MLCTSPTLLFTLQLEVGDEVKRTDADWDGYVGASTSAGYKLPEEEVRA